MGKISNAEGIAPVSLYTPDAFVLEGVKTPDGALLSDLLREQLSELDDCVAVLHDTLIGYYHNGCLITTQSISKYSSPISVKNGVFKDGKGK